RGLTRHQGRLDGGATSVGSSAGNQARTDVDGSMFARNDKNHPCAARGWCGQRERCPTRFKTKRHARGESNGESPGASEYGEFGPVLLLECHSLVVLPSIEDRH